jgi:hypothetical protein
LCEREIKTGERRENNIKKRLKGAILYQNG